ncbi:MAG: hypothetical protein FGF48_11035, partial [Candidatus Brockarchaeota archaeon]|nr:hypothetical protein [Candidatus Brockarchaeota archaeon]
LIDTICEDIPNLPRIPLYIREGAKRVIKSVQTHYSMRGRRRIAIVVVALGIARGDDKLEDLKDLLYRAEYFTSEKIPQGQIRNTFEDLRTFLRQLHLYKSNRRGAFNSFTAEERMVLKVLRAERLPQRGRQILTTREYLSPAETSHHISIERY